MTDERQTNRGYEKRCVLESRRVSSGEATESAGLSIKVVSLPKRIKTHFT